MRYFFHTINGSRDLDTEGTELGSLASARQHAVQYAAACMADDPDMLWRADTFRVEVKDADDVLLFSIVTRGLEASRTPNESAPGSSGS